MENYIVALGSAFWLGVLTSISPCPLATNITAISYIGKRIDRPSGVLVSGLVYTFGRMITYVGIAVLVVGSVLAIPDVAMFLQQNMNKALGPVLIVAGLLLLGIFNVSVGSHVSERLAKRIESWGVVGAGLLGLLFALSFCPVSAALYFGSLIPIALDHQSTIVVPTLYGIGTAIPVVVFAVLIAFGARFVGKAFDRIAVFERWARRVTAVLFLAVGVYYVLIHLLGIDI